VDVTSLVPSNIMLTPDSLDTGGAAGRGGSSPGVFGATGADGIKGVSANVRQLVSCGLGCPSGMTCDANRVCVDL
jgi:hypothetical protein